MVQDEDKRPVYLATSAFDPEALSDEEAGELYAARWGVEVFCRTAKQTMERQVLRGRTPENCYLELTWTVLGVWLLELTAALRLAAAGHDPREVSTAQARTVARRATREKAPKPRATTPARNATSRPARRSSNRRPRSNSNEPND